MGKSSAAAHLLWKNASLFDLVICFVGSANCNPVLQSLLERYWDTRFFFSEWKSDLITNLLQQQERLGDQKRSILIILDDVSSHRKTKINWRPSRFVGDTSGYHY